MTKEELIALKEQSEKGLLINKEDHENVIAEKDKELMTLKEQLDKAKAATTPKIEVKQDNAKAQKEMLGYMLMANREVAKANKQNSNITFEQAFDNVKSRAYGSVQDTVSNAKNLFIGAQKDITASETQQAGALIPEATWDEIIPIIYNQSAVMQAQPVMRTILPGQSLKQHKWDGQNVVYWNYEQQKGNASDIQVKEINWSLNRADVMTIVSNDWLDSVSTQNANSLVNNLTNALAVEIDSVALLSSGGNNKPLGMAGLIASANKFDAASGGATIANFQKSIIEGLKRISAALKAQYNRGRTVIFMNTATQYGVYALAGTADTYIASIVDEFRTNNTIFGHQVFITDNIPSNGGAGTNESKVYIMDMTKFIHATDGRGFRLDSTNVASVKDNTGTTVDLWQINSTAYNVSYMCDNNVYYDTAGAVIDKFTIGAYS